MGLRPYWGYAVPEWPIRQISKAHDKSSWAFTAYLMANLCEIFRISYSQVKLKRSYSYVFDIIKWSNSVLLLFSSFLKWVSLPAKIVFFYLIEWKREDKITQIAFRSVIETFVSPMSSVDYQMFEKPKMKRRFGEIKRRFILPKRRFSRTKRRVDFVFLWGLETLGRKQQMNSDVK